jgi:hypothetical protein
MNMRSILLSATAVGALALALPAQAENNPIKVKSVEFTSTPAPSNEMEMVLPYTRSSAVVTLSDGRQKTFPLSYQILHRSGDFVGGWYSGLVVDKDGKPVMQSAPDSKGNVGRGPFLSRGTDGTSMLAIPNATVDGVKGHTVFLITISNTTPRRRMSIRKSRRSAFTARFPWR